MRVTAPLLSVGSLPFDTAQETFESCGPAIGRYLPALSDGEVGERWDWIGYLERRVYLGHPDLEPDAGELPGLEDLERKILAGDRAAQSLTYRNRRFKIKPDTDHLRFDDLFAGQAALESYRVFKRMREAEVIPPGVRFQFCLPGTSSAIEPYFDDADDWPTAKRAYEEGVKSEVGRLLEKIPAQDLAVQFDLCFEIMDLTLEEGESFFDWAPSQADSERWERHTAQLEELWRAVPDEALLGYHLCYGTWGGWPMVALKDMALCAEFANQIVARSGRHVDYIHLPVGPQPDQAFFEPAKALDVGDTKLYLGLIHLADGLAGFRERVGLARRFVDDFGVAGVCGFGRNNPSEAPTILRLLQQCAADLDVALGLAADREQR